MLKKNRQIFVRNFAECNSHLIRPNENKMSDGKREYRALGRHRMDGKAARVAVTERQRMNQRASLGVNGVDWQATT